MVVHVYNPTVLEVKVLVAEGLGLYKILYQKAKQKNTNKANMK